MKSEKEEEEDEVEEVDNDDLDDFLHTEINAKRGVEAGFQTEEREKCRKNWLRDLKDRHMDDGIHSIAKSPSPIPYKKFLVPI